MFGKPGDPEVCLEFKVPVEMMECMAAQSPSEWNEVFNKEHTSSLSYLREEMCVVTISWQRTVCHFGCHLSGQSHPLSDRELSSRNDTTIKLYKNFIITHCIKSLLFLPPLKKTSLSLPSTASLVAPGYLPFPGSGLGLVTAMAMEEAQLLCSQGLWDEVYRPGR